MFHSLTLLELQIFTALELLRLRTQNFLDSVESKMLNTLKEVKEAAVVAEVAVAAEVAAVAEVEIAQISVQETTEVPEEVDPSLLTLRKLSQLSEG